MINKLNLTHFKAFKEPVEMVFDSKNVLIYGENGAGKSSLYQALKVFFHRQRIFDAEIPATITDPRDRQNAEDDVLSRNNYQKEPLTDFELKINDTDYKAYTPANCDVSMISREDILATSEIEVVSFLRRSVVGIADAAAFVGDKKALIETTVNDLLNTYFCEENITVELTYRDPQWLLTIKDSNRDTRGRNEKLTEYFNEAKLHIVKLLLLLTAVLNNGAKERGEERVLVLDDVLTSMDAANRAVFIKLLANKFGDYQKILLTHSVSFFNLAEHSFRAAYQQKGQWKLYQVVEYPGNSVIVVKGAVDEAYKIKNAYRPGVNEGVIGGRIRKRFEQLVQEVSEMIYSGGLSETSDILNSIAVTKKLYYEFDEPSKKLHTVYDLVDELDRIIKAAPASQLKTDLDAVMVRYASGTELDCLKEILCDLRVYQKVSMHPLSHSVGPVSFTTQRECDRAISLLIQMEKHIGKLKGLDLYSL